MYFLSKNSNCLLKSFCICVFRTFRIFDQKYLSLKLQYPPKITMSKIWFYTHSVSEYKKRWSYIVNSHSLCRPVSYITILSAIISLTFLLQNNFILGKNIRAFLPTWKWWLLKPTKNKLTVLWFHGKCNLNLEARAQNSTVDTSAQIRFQSMDFKHYPRKCLELKC